MNFRSIPHTDLRISVICLGTMTFGNPVPPADAIKLVHSALDHGINFFDTADMYEGYDRRPGSAGGVAETILGSALRDCRDRAIVVTKVGSDVGGSGLGRTHVLRQIDASLKRLQSDHVDIYLMHKPDPNTLLPESIATMNDLIAAGRIRHWGFSNFDAHQVREMIQMCDTHGWQRPVVSQPPYSWLKRDIEAEHLPVCRDLEIAVTPYQPLQCGLLTGKYRRGQPLPNDSRAGASPGWLTVREELFDRLDSFEAEAHAAKMQPSQYAMSWLLRQLGVTSVIVGVRTADQLTAAIQAGNCSADGSAKCAHLS